MCKGLTYFIASMAILSAVMIPLGCSQSNPDAPPPGQVHADKYVNPEAAAFHGIEVFSAGTDGCVLCHGNDLTGTSSVPGCYDCHFDASGSRVPPGSAWTHGEDGHIDYEAFQDVCNNCHETVRRFALPPEYCHNCHGEGLNHLLGRPWLDKNSPDFHGDSALADCDDCHNLNVKCFQCHFGANGSRIPPGSGWTHGNNDAHERQEAYQTTCNTCHSINRSYGNGPASCHDCHEDDDD